ncbi:MAG TPA: DUF480 domain-containing protein, partial [Planctomycetota bacterium]|nr:DUF480 domain-containing protein [Planctomycetota bacterium]
EAPLAVLAELLLRGPQSGSSLRANASRMQPLPSLEDLQRALTPLEAAHLVRLIPAGGGSRVPLYAQTLCEAQNAQASPQAVVSQAAHRAQTATPTKPQPNLESLEQRVATLEQQLKSLAERLGEEL